MNKRILIATDISFMHRMKGNSNRINSIYNCLKKHHDVDVFFFTEGTQVQDNIHYYQDWLPEDKKAVTILQPYNISSKVKYEYKLAFDNFIESVPDYEYIILPYIWNSYILDTKPKTNSKFIIDTHDSFSERTKNLAEHGYQFTSACSVEDEKFCLRNFDYIMAISDKEEEIFRNMGYDNVFTAKYFYKPQKNKTKLGFIGGNSIHNIDAINWFYNNVFKDTLDNDYFLYICGDIAKHKDVQKLKGLKNIVLYEYIWNIEDFYNMVDICINPCQIGSGLKIKNIEAMSFRKPIITSDIGLEGMNEEYEAGIIIEANSKDGWINSLKYCEDIVNNINRLIKLDEYKKTNNEEKVYKSLLDILEEGE